MQLKKDIDPVKNAKFGLSICAIMFFACTTMQIQANDDPYITLLKQTALLESTNLYNEVQKIKHNDWLNQPSYRKIERSAKILNQINNVLFIESLSNHKGTVSSPLFGSLEE